MTRAGIGQTRTFAYNGAMQLQSVSTPETGTTAANGTVSYTYNADGTPATQTDAKNSCDVSLFRQPDRCGAP